MPTSATDMIKLRLKEHQISLEELTDTYNGLYGPTMTANNMSHKIRRGTFSFVFGLELLETIDYIVANRKK